METADQEKTELHSDRSTASNATAFPVGMKVLLVDHRVCLRILSCMLKTCGYHVTECEQHKEALELLRESKFDLVISNVSNASESDIDGFKLLEFVGLEMDLPLIIVSSDSSRETIMKAIQHGACDYLIKPIQQKEVAIIWKHVVRRKNINKAVPESSGSLEKINNGESFRRNNDDANGDVRQSRKKKREIAEDDDGELENGEESRKKGRFNWNGERHKQFVSAVNQLGVNIPKKILSVLNIPGLKREHVASHLQKYRMGLRKAEKEKHGQQFQHVNSLIGVNLNPIMGPASNFSFQTLLSRPATWNNHAPNIMPPLPTMPQIESNSNAPRFLVESHDMLWNVVTPEQLPVHHMSVNPLLSNQNYALRNMQQGSNDTLYTGNNLLGFRSTASQPSLFASRNRGFNSNANAFNGSLGSGFVQNGYCQAWGGTDRTESPTSNLTCGNSDAILNTNSWDLDGQM